MNPELQLLIERSANIYFWLFIAIFILEVLYHFTDNYKEIHEIKKKLGKLPHGITVVNFIFWFLFILSTYYK